MTCAFLLGHASIMLHFFRLPEHRTTPGREILGGVTTFVTMAYIIVVNPAILAAAGLDVEASTAATILAAAFGCLLMGFYANRPFAVAPYMGENAFIAFTLTHILIDGQFITWQQRLGTVFVSGVLFLLLTLMRLRTWLAAAISPSLKHGFAVGIGMFLLLIGLYQTGIVTSFVEGQPLAAVADQDQPGLVGRPAAPLKIGDFADRRLQLAIGGFGLMAALLAWRVPGAILIGIAATAGAGALLGLADAPSAVVAAPWNLPLDKVAFQLDIIGVLKLGFLPILLTLFLVSFLDTLGTLFALGSAANLLDSRGNLPQVERPMLVDSVSCIFSALIGTSTSGAYIESAAGIREGARSGLAAVVTGLLFLACLLFVPLVQPMQKMTFAWGPALIIVGLLMFGAVRHVDFDDLTELVSVLATIALMVFTYNIANGMAAGLILHPLFKALSGRWREVHLGGWLLGGMCLAYFVVGRPH